MAKKGKAPLSVNPIIAKEFEKSFSDATEKFLPGVSINIVVFNYRNGQLSTLIMRLAGTQYFMLSGGYVMKYEDLDDAASRIFIEWTGLHQTQLEQFYTSGKADRISDHLVKEILEKAGNFTADPWFGQRKISVCYYALLNESEINLPKSEFPISEYQWINIPDIPPLLFDHNHIIEKAIKKMQDNLDRIIATRPLFTKEFTMGELQKFYEAVFHKSFTRTNFQRRMLNLDILERIGKHYSGKAHKAPYLYRMKQVKETL